MNATPRLKLPFISPGQAQKELLHNEALQRLDMLVAGSVEEPPRVSPPSQPQLGQCYLVGAGASDDWAGFDDCLAAYTEGGWRFVPGREGMAVYVRSLGMFAIYDATGWQVGPVRCSAVFIGGSQVLGPAAAPIVLSTGGTTVDAEARSAIRAILTALRGHGLVKT
jgi:hypothetical protein